MHTKSRRVTSSGRVGDRHPDRHTYNRRNAAVCRVVDIRRREVRQVTARPLTGRRRTRSISPASGSIGSECVAVDAGPSSVHDLFHRSAVAERSLAGWSDKFVVVVLDVRGLDVLANQSLWAACLEPV